MKWDADSVHLMFKVADDSIVNEGTQYQVDNIELYFDMDNSKRIHWPRNGGYMENDTTFDDNDYQLRLIPGMAWDYATENQNITGIKYQNVVDTAGYTIHLAIPWDSLLLGFTPAIGTRIGFDVLISDNDAVASDPNRNQITFNSVTIYPYNDPSLWATLELDTLGGFKVIADTIVPSVPTNAVAVVAGASVNLTWDASTDNIAVHQYVISQNNAVIDTVFALKSNNKATISNLTAGTYTFAVAALDIYANRSAAVTTTAVEVTGVNVKTNSISALTVYPNPANEYINIINIKGTQANIRIFNTAGQMVLKQSIADNDNVNISSLRNGIYTIEVIDNDQVSVIKMIKK